jgi:lipopolysaccharide export system protein LptA
VLVMTGHGLKLMTPSDTLTARDTLEYWSDKHMAVARGDAVVVTNDARRISADTLVAYTVAAAASGAGQSAPGSATSASATPGSPAAGSAPPAPSGPGAATSSMQKQTSTQAANPTGDPTAAMAGRLERVEAFGNVTIRTLTDIVIGDRGVYVPETGIAHLGGHVRITRGLNQINGAEAVVNMKTGVASLLSGATGRVSGLVVPNDQSNPPPGNAMQNQPPATNPKSDQPKRGATQ